VVESEEVLYAAFGSVSPASETVAVFVTPGTAPAATATTRAKLMLAPLAMGVEELVQLTVWPTAPHANPLPPLPLETNVNPAGKVSMTVIVPVVAELPTLVTVML